MNFLFNSSNDVRENVFKLVFEARIPNVNFINSKDFYNPNDIDFIFTWLPMDNWSDFGNLKIVFSVSAGVDQFESLPKEIKLVKMFDENNKNRVSEYVLTAVLSCLKGFPNYSMNQNQRVWKPNTAKLIEDTNVFILGLGDIGIRTAETLMKVGFNVSGWSRSIKELNGLKSYAGFDQLYYALKDQDVVVCLLPLTKETRNILDKKFFYEMKRGSSIVHTGRGGHCNYSDLKNALDQGILSSSVIDVFINEPLDRKDPVWDLNNTILTPHVAGRIDDETAANNVASNIENFMNGNDLKWLIDRSKGY